MHHTSSSCSTVQNRLIWSQLLSVIYTRSLLKWLAVLQLFRCISNRELSLCRSFHIEVQAQNPASWETVQLSQLSLREAEQTDQQLGCTHPWGSPTCDRYNMDYFLLCNIWQWYPTTRPNSYNQCFSLISLVLTLFFTSTDLVLRDAEHWLLLLELMHE